MREVIITLDCAKCGKPVDQKTEISILAPGVFEVKIEDCSCGGKEFEMLRAVREEEEL